MSLKAVQFNRSLGPLRISGDVRAVLAGLVLFALLVNLGSWQLGRAGEKSALAARWEARAAMPAMAPEVLLSDAPSTEAAAALADRQVRWQASFSADHYLLLDNRLHHGRAGYHVIALAESDAGLIPVNFGWLAGDPSRRTTPTPTLPTGLRGNAASYPSKASAPSQATSRVARAFASLKAHHSAHKSVPLSRQALPGEWGLASFCEKGLRPASLNSPG